MMFPKKRPTPPARRQLEEALRGEKKPHKFGARRTVCSRGHPHPSQLESDVCEILILREKSGDIRSLKWQATVELAFSVRWKIDWSFEQSPDWHERWAEAKGAATPDFRLKLRMWQAGAGKGPLELWKGNKHGPYLEKVIVPERGE